MSKKFRKELLVIGAVLVLIGGGIGLLRVNAEKVSPTAGVTISLDSNHIDRIISMFEEKVTPESEEESFGGLVSVGQRIFPQGFKAGSTNQSSIDSSGNFVTTGSIDVGRFRQGGTVTTLYASTTLTAAQVCNSSVISVAASSTVHQAGITLTFPATSTLYSDCLTINGDSIDLLIVNATSSSGASTTFAEGTGIEMKHATTSGIIVAPQEISKITFTRLNDGTSSVEIVNLVDGD